ncbi:nucleotidyltransferase domain-containing protein [Kineococcus aurantiacus]|uniref:Putative nucleotidyltransferase n=1 Tax=Kineococcus aurantiacus TaxID=37633 RepID=A0A7Y9DKL9_9ACTN|nr:putative nucleotidyltransferase [Kineococcus aurantiacus]
MDPRSVAARLVEVPGVVGVTLGGSRARGEHTPDSDTDLGVHYRPPLDVAALQALADELSDVPVVVTGPGGWGPWVDGGGWLRLDGHAVDWILRDVDRVRRSGQDALAGRFDWHFQVGHPLGFPGTTYAGELFHGVLLADPAGELAAARLTGFPPALRTAVVGRLDEARFLLGGAAKAVPRGDRAYVAACVFRVVLLCVHALHADAGRFVLNEKGAVAATARLPRAPRGFAERAQALFAAAPGAALDGAAELLDETCSVTGAPGHPSA